MNLEHLEEAAEYALDIGEQDNVFYVVELTPHGFATRGSKEFNGKVYQAKRLLTYHQFADAKINLLIEDLKHVRKMLKEKDA